MMKDSETQRDEENKAEIKIYKEYLVRKRDKLIKENQELDRLKQKRYEERSKQDTKHYGRFGAFRSEKPKVKKQKVDKEVPQHVKDYMTYLGDIAQIFLMDESAVVAAAEGK